MLQSTGSPRVGHDGATELMRNLDQPVRDREWNGGVQEEGDQVLHLGLLLTMRAISFLLRGSCPQQQI